jgi:hypothetical protein
MTHSDNWPEQLYAELNRRGVGTLVAFADSVGCTTYAELAAALEDTFAPIQMMIALRDEFAERDDARGFAADCLYRYLHQYATEPGEAFTAWEAALGGASDATRLVSRLLRERVLEGWLPSGPDDLLLLGVMAAQRWHIARD